MTSIGKGNDIRPLYVSKIVGLLMGQLGNGYIVSSGILAKPFAHDKGNPYWPLLALIGSLAAEKMLKELKTTYKSSFTVWTFLPNWLS